MLLGGFKKSLQVNGVRNSININLTCFFSLVFNLVSFGLKVISPTSYFLFSFTTPLGDQKKRKTRTKFQFTALLVFNA